MGKIWVEVCLISARGIHRGTSLLKLQRYAVGWIDPKNKYCTKIDASGNANPVWETKFSTLIDTSDKDFSDLALNVEVYSREPIFLRERLLGTATVILKEFLEKYLKDSEISKPVEEKGSFQMRKKNSNKPQGFIDISIRISEEREEFSSHSGNQEGIVLMDHNNGINLNKEYRPQQLNQTQLFPPQQMEIRLQEASQYGHIRPVSRVRPNYASAETRPSYNLGGGTSYPQAQPPPPPLNVGYMPTFLPKNGNAAPPSYINMPSSSSSSSSGAVPRHGSRPGFGMGLGAGALAAGAMIFGDDLMSGFDVPLGLQDASISISTDPPF